ncbi:MAG: hypothetical protein IBX61_03265 [Thermoleophilia bacterium]|nr:hypothetical protein [Thermoleophilia bacterium]
MFFGLVLSAGSAVGLTYLLRRMRRQARVELYFDDGSMLAINSKTSELSARLTSMADDLLRNAM